MEFAPSCSKSLNCPRNTLTNGVPSGVVMDMLPSLKLVGILTNMWLIWKEGSVLAGDGT